MLKSNMDPKMSMANKPIKEYILKDLAPTHIVKVSRTIDYY